MMGNMKRFIIICSVLLLVVTRGILAQARSWEGIHQVSLSEAEKQFGLPPVEFASHVIWGWEGPMDKQTIRKDLDSIKSKGFRSVIFEAGYKLPYEYLSDKWFFYTKKERTEKTWKSEALAFITGFSPLGMGTKKIWG